MTTRKGIREIFLLKRYNLLETMVFVAMMAAIMVVGARDGQIRLVKTFLTQSPLPDVVLAEEAEFSGAKGYAKAYDFTSDWFSGNIPVWEKALAPFKGQPGVEYLEVGVYEGRATMWMIENILTHPTSRLTGIDLFEGDYSDHYGSFKERYLANLQLSGAANRAVTIQGFSQEVLRGLPLNSFDIIYIDGSHLNGDVLEDAVLSWRLLKDGGVLIFDDYGDGLTDPKMGIETFVHYLGKNFDIIHNSHQLLMKRKASGMPIAKAKS